MYVVIVGCGRIGSNLARSLMTVGNEITVVDHNPVKLQRAADELGCVTVQGNGTSVSALREAGARRAETVIAVTGDDAANLAVCQMAKQVFDATSTVALIKDPSYAGLFRLLGVDRVINSSHLILTSIEESAPTRSLMHLLDLQHHNVDIVALSIPRDAKSVGKTIGALELPPYSFITLVVKDAGPTLPSDDLVLEAGDEVIAVTVLSEEQDIYETLTGSA